MGDGAAVTHVLTARDRADCGVLVRRFSVQWRLHRTPNGWRAIGLTAVEMGSTPVTRFFDAVGDVLPAPNGQRFVANPLTMWVVTASRATVGGSDLGEMGPAPEQARLGGFYIPQRGVFVIGRAIFSA